jgi:hypothetical protein
MLSPDLIRGKSCNDSRQPRDRVKGRAHKLIQEFRERHSGLAGTFLMSRLILVSRIIPERITPDVDDPELEARLEAAIAKLTRERTPA